MKKTASLTTAQKAMALLLSLLLVFSLLAPLGGLFNVVSAAEDNAAFYDDREYYVNVSALSADYKDIFKGLITGAEVKVGVQFVNKAGVLQWNDSTIGTLGGSYGEYSENDKDYIFKISASTSSSGASAARIILRDTTVTNPFQNQPARAESDIRVIFQADSVQAMETTDNVTFTNPAITALNARGAAVNIGNTVSATGTKMEKYKDSGKENVYYIDIDKSAFENSDAIAFRFSCEPEADGGRYTTAPLEILEHGGYVLYQGAIPRHPRIYEINASQLAGNSERPGDQLKVNVAQANSSGAVYQNYFVLSDEEQFIPSKYFFPSTITDNYMQNELFIRRKVWVYNADWTGNNIYATGDLGDILHGTVTLNKDTAMGNGWFVTSSSDKPGLVPGATYVFHPTKEDPTLDASEPTTIPLKNADGAVIPQITTSEEYQAVAENYFTPAYDDGRYNGTGYSSTVALPDTVYYMSRSASGQWLKKSNTHLEYDELVMKPNNNTDNYLYWADATYYDYFSDQEIVGNNTSNWLKPWGKYSETDVNTYNTYASDMFSLLNSRIHRLALTDEYWRYPLYFGNFYGEMTQSPTQSSGNSSNPATLLNAYYEDLVAQLDARNINAPKFWAANNSNGLGSDDSRYFRSVMGLAYPELRKTFYGAANSEYANELLVGNAGQTLAPYFNAEWLMGESASADKPQCTTEYKKIGETGCFFLVIPKIFAYIRIDENDFTKGSRIPLSQSFGKVLYTNNPSAWYPPLSSDVKPEFEGLDNNIYNVCGADDDYYYIVINNKPDNGGGNWSRLKFNLYTSSSVYANVTVSCEEKQSIIPDSDIHGSSFLSTRSGYVVQSLFPFRVEKDERTGVTHYRFNSGKNGNEHSGDIVNFHYNSSSNNLHPDQVNYYYNNETQSVPNIRFDDEYSQWGGDTGYFPFNNGHTTNAHNFGFGTKIEMKFKLPKGGKFTTKDEEEEPVKFTFAGDDDVWVFVDGQLVLDLGGAHKQSTGTIDFGYGTNQIQGTSDKVAYAMNDVQDYEGATRLYEFVIDPAVIKKDESGAPFDDTTPFVFFDNSSTSGETSTGQYIFKGTGADSDYNYSILEGKLFSPRSGSTSEHSTLGPVGDNISEAKYKSYYNEEDGKYYIYAMGTEDENGWLDCAMRIEGTGEVILPQVKLIAEPSYSPLSDSEQGTGAQTITANINNTDPSMVHTMTIYYLERGMGESNLYIDFTTIPANTDVQVQKNVATENLNPGLVSGMEEVAKKEEVDRDAFAFHVAPYTSPEFLSQDINNSQYKDTPFSRTDDFTHKTDGSTVGADAAGLSDVLAANTDNAFLLQDQQTADFGTYFAIGDKLTIGEAGGEELKDIQSRYRYETYFRLLNGGTIVDPDKDNTFLQAGGESKTGNIKQAEQGYYKFNQSDGSVNTSVSFSVDYDNPGSPDLSQTVSRVLQYYNKVKTTDLLVSAEVLDGESYETDKDTGNYKSRVFAFKLECFIGGKWHALPLNATVFAYDKDGDPIANTSWDTHLSDDGMFILSQHNKILIHGLPINLPYRVKEIRSNQFKTLGYFINNDYNTVTGSAGTSEPSPTKQELVENYLVPLTESGGNYATNSSSDEQIKNAVFSAMTEKDGTTSAFLPNTKESAHYLCSTYQGQDGVFVLNPCYDGSSGAEAEQVANPDEALAAYNGKTTSAEALPNTVKRANSIQFVHTYEPAPGVLEVQKTVNGEPAEGPEYDGRFQFNAELIDAYVTTEGIPKDVDDEAGLEKYTNLNFVPAVNDSDSIARFTGVSYSTEGYYLYALSETSGSDDKYTYSTEKYYAVVHVTASEQPGQFDTNVTYYDSGIPEPQVSDSYNKDANKWPCCGEQYAGEVFQGEKHIPIFHNATGVQHTDVTFTKLEAASKSPLANAKFTLYTDEDCKQEGQKGAAGALGVASSQEDSQFTNPGISAESTGKVTFADLDFTDGGNTKPKQGDTVAVDVVLTAIPDDLTAIPDDQTLGSVSGVLSLPNQLQDQLQLDSRFAVGDSPDAAVYNGATVSIDSVEPDSGTLSYTVTFPDSGLTAADIGDGLIIARFTFTALSDIDTQASKAVVVDNAVQSATSFGTSEPGESLPNVTGYGKSYVPTAYYFKETEAPDGYSPLTGIFRVSIYSDGTYTIQYCADPAATDKKWEDTVDDILVKDASGAVSVMNTASAKPPFVGGTGTCLLRFAGWLALAVCAAGCVMMAFGAAVRAKKRKG